MHHGPSQTQKYIKKTLLSIKNEAASHRHKGVCVCVCKQHSSLRQTLGFFKKSDLKNKS